MLDDGEKLLLLVEDEAIIAMAEKNTLEKYGYVVMDSSGTVLDASIKMAFKLFDAKIREKEKENALQEAKGRVNGVRILYDKLPLSESYRDIAAKSYVESLVATAVSLNPSPAKVKLNLRIDDISLNRRKVFPLGIIIDEPLTNSSGCSVSKWTGHSLWKGARARGQVSSSSSSSSSSSKSSSSSSSSSRLLSSNSLSSS